jgi:hypothetical protein
LRRSGMGLFLGGKAGDLDPPAAAPNLDVSPKRPPGCQGQSRVRSRCYEVAELGPKPKSRQLNIRIPLIMKKC